MPTIDGAVGNLKEISEFNVSSSELAELLRLGNELRLEAARTTTFLRHLPLRHFGGLQRKRYQRIRVSIAQAVDTGDLVRLGDGLALDLVYQTAASLVAAPRVDECGLGCPPVSDSGLSGG